METQKIKLLEEEITKLRLAIEVLCQYIYDESEETIKTKEEFVGFHDDDAFVPFN